MICSHEKLDFKPINQSSKSAVKGRDVQNKNRTLTRKKKLGDLKKKQNEIIATAVQSTAFGHVTGS
jgi:hypothetical protein